VLSLHHNALLRFTPAAPGTLRRAHSPYVPTPAPRHRPTAPPHRFL